MPLFNGGKEIDQVFIGTKEVQQIYSGTKEIWSNVKVINLGSGTSWNIKQLYPNLYSKLTSANFFVRTAGQAAGSNGIRMRASDTEREWAGFSGGLAKSYDPNTGILYAYNYISPGTTNGSAVAIMVTKLDKLIYLGEGQSFNVSGRSGYKNFSEDNFLVVGSGTASGGNNYYPQGYDYSDYGSGTVNLQKWYDKNSGVLTCRIYLHSEDTGGVYHYFDFDSYANVQVYLAEKI